MSEGSYVPIVRVSVESLSESSEVAKRLAGLKCIICYKNDEGLYVDWNPESDSAEVQRLRDALEKVAHTPAYGGCVSFGACVVLMESIAREALEAKP